MAPLRLPPLADLDAAPAPPRLAATPTLTPFLKWPGGKTQELPAVAALAPPLTGRFVDPFVGGGSVLFAVPAEVPALANDACRDLVSLYLATATREPVFREAVTALAGAWEQLSGLDALFGELATAFEAVDLEHAERALTRHLGALSALFETAGTGLASGFLERAKRDLPLKFRRMRRVEGDVGRPLSRRDLLANVEGAVRAALYMAVRARYNGARVARRWDAVRSADFLFLREFAYAAMFRFNRRNEFNVPYGGVSYNRKSLASKLDVLFAAPMAERLAATSFTSRDFEPFLHDACLEPDDFVFVDPPYDSDFSDYDNLSFGSADQLRLRDALASVPSRVMVVIKDTRFVRELYADPRWRLRESPKTYMWTIKSRNDRSATHLTITNY